MRNKAKYGLNEKLKYEEINPGVDWIFTLIRNECFRPYFVENWIMIVDADEMGVFNFPIGFFSNLLKMTQINHPACLHKMFIVNPPFSIGAIYSMLSRSRVLTSLPRQRHEGEDHFPQEERDEEDVRLHRPRPTPGRVRGHAAHAATHLAAGGHLH